MCLQGRALIDVTVSDHLKLVFDAFKELISAHHYFGARAWCRPAGVVASAAELFAALECVSSRGGLSSLGGASRMAARSFFSGDEFRCFPDTIPPILLQITA